jgi:hypothetical protein
MGQFGCLGVLDDHPEYRHDGTCTVDQFRLGKHVHSSCRARRRLWRLEQRRTDYFNDADADAIYDQCAKAKWWIRWERRFIFQCLGIVRYSGFEGVKER